MVLWELTLATAYFLGLKRTYRLALKTQRKLIKHPRIRQFANRRTRSVFDVAIKVHRSIQERDLEVGRNLGNRILRWLDRMKPSAEIRPKPPLDCSASSTEKKLHNNSSTLQKTSSTIQRNRAITEGRESNRGFFTSSWNVWPKSFPSVSKMMRPTNPAGTKTRHQHFSTYGALTLYENHGGFGYKGGGVREDILQWMMLPK